MGNLEKPLTWALTILFLGYLIVANCKCGEESSCSQFMFTNATENSNNNGLLISVTPLLMQMYWNLKAIAEAVEVEADAMINDTSVVAETNDDSVIVEVETETEVDGAETEEE